MSSSISAGLSHQDLWEHFKEQANSLKESMASTSTWVFGVASGILAFVADKFLSFQNADIQAHNRSIGTVLSAVGALLVVHALATIRHFDRHIHGNWARALACEPHLPGIGTIIQAGNVHDEKVPTLASRLRVFVWLYLAAFLAVIVLLWST